MTTVAKLRKGPPTITFNVTPEEFDMVHQFAFRAGISVSLACHLAMIRLINDAEAGTIPLLPEYQDGITQPGHC